MEKATLFLILLFSVGCVRTEYIYLGNQSCQPCEYEIHSEIECEKVREKIITETVYVNVSEPCNCTCNDTDTFMFVKRIQYLEGFIEKNINQTERCLDYDYLNQTYHQLKKDTEHCTGNRTLLELQLTDCTDMRDELQVNLTECKLNISG